MLPPHSPRERRSGSLSGLLLKPERDPEEPWLLEQRGGQCCSPSAQLLAARGSLPSRHPVMPGGNFDVLIGSHSLVEARDVAMSPTRQPTTKKDLATSVTRAGIQ